MMAYMGRLRPKEVLFLRLSVYKLKSVESSRVAMYMYDRGGKSHILQL